MFINFATLGGTYGCNNFGNLLKLFISVVSLEVTFYKMRTYNL